MVKSIRGNAESENMQPWPSSLFVCVRACTSVRAFEFAEYIEKPWQGNNYHCVMCVKSKKKIHSTNSEIFIVHLRIHGLW